MTRRIAVWHGYVFVTGFAVLVIELTASRLLAPYYGSSIVVWANIIAVVLAALAVGYQWGGKLADRQPRAEVLYWLTLAAGCLTAVIPWLVRWLVQALEGGNWLTSSLILLSLLVTAVTFFLPLMLLGAVTPFVIRLVNASVETSGQVAGGVFAVSTVGSILGTFVTAFLLVPFVGSRGTIEIAAGLLVLLALIGLVHQARRRWLLVLLLLPTGMFLIERTAAIRPVAGLVTERDTAYQFLQVVDTETDRRLVFNEGRGSQSIRPNDGRLAGTYYELFLFLPLLQDKPRQSVALLGLAAGTISQLYRQHLDSTIDLAIDGVEIDPVVVEVARQYFSLDQQRVNVTVADARQFIERSTRQYDNIVIDVYRDEFHLPFHLATSEFFQSVQQHLTPGGLVGLNFIAQSPDAPLFRRLIATVRTVFPNVIVWHPPGTLNYLLIGSVSPVSLDRLSLTDQPGLTPILAHAFDWQMPLPALAEPLTDDRAPVELLTDSIFLSAIDQPRL